MNIRETDFAMATEVTTSPNVRGTLFRRYVTLFVTVVGVALTINGVFQLWFSYREQKNLLIDLQREQAEAAADKIDRFIKEIEGHIGWTTQLPWMSGDLDDRHLDALRLLRQMPAITELAQFDRQGREKLRVSRLIPDRIDGNDDVSKTAWFKEVTANDIYYGPVYFFGESEPYMTLAMAGARSDTAISFAAINLKFVWDVVTQIKIGTKGQAYVIDGSARLIAHPDVSLMLRNTDLSRLTQVRAALDGKSEPVQVADDVNGRRVLTAYARIAPLGWLLFVELPIDEAYSSIYASIYRSGALLLAALALAFLASLFLARNMVGPIRALSEGAASIGRGDLGRRITIESGDELEALGHEFNGMAARLQDSYSNLERKVEERTHQLEIANLAKSRFLAAASHDLRQPLHALGLFVAQLHTHPGPAEREQIVRRIDAAVAAMNELFSGLLDISKLNSGALSPNLVDFPIAQMLTTTETTFAQTACEKGLKFRVVPSSLWVQSDVILLGRILLNLVSNAVRYTDIGSIVVGCRRRGKRVRIEVWDSGSGIPEDQRRNIFGEFYRLAGPGRDRHGGLGLGLAIVDRLCRLLDHPIGLISTPGKGSCFSVELPVADHHAAAVPPPILPPIASTYMGKLIIVLDDDALVLEGMGGLLRAWGCLVVVAESPAAALAAFADGRLEPALIISDYHLSCGNPASKRSSTCVPPSGHPSRLS